MKIFAAILGIVLLLLSATFIYLFYNLPDQSVEIDLVDTTETYIDESDRTIVVQYNESKTAAKVTFLDETFDLTQGEVDDGQQYASVNQLVVLLIDDETATFDIGGNVISAVLVTPETMGESEPEIEQPVAVVDTPEVIVVEPEAIAVVDVPVLGQRCVDSDTVDCAALEAAANQMVR